MNGLMNNSITDPMVFAQMRYGFFVHYIAAAAFYADGRQAGSIDEAADGFDVAGFADDLAAMRVEYLIFTAWHYRVQLLYPSAVMEEWRPGNCARRDLVGEIIDAARRKDIRVILYTHPRDGHDFPDDDRVRTGWGLGHDEGRTDTPNPLTFDYDKWNRFMLALYTELLERYASRIDGLFIDGMGPGRFIGGSVGSQSYTFPIIDYLKIRQIAKQHNPQIALIQNFFGYRFTCDYEMPEGFFGYEEIQTDTAFWPACRKALALLGFSGWAANRAKGLNTVRYTVEDMIRFTVFQSTCSAAGGIAWATGPYCSGGWESGVRETMTAVGRYLERLGDSIRAVKPSNSWPTVSGDTLVSKGWIAAASSEDRQFEYIHILKNRKGGVVLLPPPQDGAGFREPAMINGEAEIVQFQQTAEGVRLVLSGNLAETDTVVRLTRINPHDAPTTEWLNDTDKRLIYRGEWVYAFLSGRDAAVIRQFKGCYEYDTHRTQTNGDWVLTVFTGDQVDLIGPLDPAGGTADVLIDEIKVGQISGGAAERLNRQVLFSSGRLYGGTHTLRVIKTGGDTLEIDAVRITA